MHMKATGFINSLKLQRAVTPTTFHFFGLKFNWVVSSSVPISIHVPNIKALAQTLLEISYIRDFNVILLKRKITLECKIAWIRKKYTGHLYLFFHEESIYKISKH